MKQWIMKWVSIILIGTLIYLAHERRPLLEDHQARLYFEATNQEITDELLNSEAWEDLEMKDLFVLTVTNDSDKNTLVSYGFGNYIKVLDDEWVRKAFKMKTPLDVR